MTSYDRKNMPESLSDWAEERRLFMSIGLD
jgi:hypothetical protein